MEQTNRLRATATATLVRAAPDARLVTATVAFLYRPPARGPVGEEHPLWHDAPASARAVVAAVDEAERITAEANGIVLRFGHLYGPGTHFAHDGSFVAQVARRAVPVVGEGSTFSFLHVDDAAAAVSAALRSPGPGVFDVVDDDPVPTSVWLPELARLIGAPPPRRVPHLVARLAGGSWGAAWSEQLVGASNARARRDLGWSPGRPTWREGFAELVRHASPGGRMT
jgi:nucleoside-diphosphate-sugar epimerase